MTSFRRLAIGCAGLCLTLTGAATAAIGGSRAAVATTSQPHGVNFTLHTATDPNFCLEDTPAPANPASQASVSQCIVRDGQQWTFANAADGSLVIIGGNTGNCLHFSAKTPSPVSMSPCTFGASERFVYTAKGQIRLASGKTCLQALQAAQDAQVDVDPCQKNSQLQIWMIGH